MFVWNPNRTLDSKIIAGVRYHFRRFSPELSAKMELSLAEYREKIRELTVAYNDGIEHVSDPKDDKDPAVRRNRGRWAAFIAEMESLRNRYERATTLRTYLTRIEGISLDGEKEQTVEELIQFGPDQLAEEALAYISENGNLTPTERGNSQSLTTSSTGDGTATKNGDTSADPAEITAGTSDAAAPATSPTT